MYRPEWQPPRSWQNTPVTRELDERILSWLARSCLALIVAMTPTGLYLLSMNASLNLTIQSTKLEKELERVTKRERDLRARVAAAETPQLLERWAEAEGFQPPTAETTVVWTFPETDREWIARRDSPAPTH